MKSLMELLIEAGFSVKPITTNTSISLKLTGLVINENLRLIYEEEQDGTLMIREVAVDQDYVNLGYTSRVLEFLNQQDSYNIILPFVTTPKLVHVCEKLGIERDDTCINKYGYNSAFYALARNYIFYEGDYGHYIVRKLDK